jgi:hypothetical protein
MLHMSAGTIQPRCKRVPSHPAAGLFAHSLRLRSTGRVAGQVGQSAGPLGKPRPPGLLGPVNQRHDPPPHVQGQRGPSRHDGRQCVIGRLCRAALGLRRAIVGLSRRAIRDAHQRTNRRGGFWVR